jgi:hypothetical protein
MMVLSENGSESMHNIIGTCSGGIPQDIDDLIYGDTGTVPSERLFSLKPI